MNEQMKIIYSEVYSILNILGDSYIIKIPKESFEFIEKERLKSYNPIYDLNFDIKEQNIKKQSIAMIALFHLNYWCNTDEERLKIKNILKNNEDELRRLYSPDNIFKNKKDNFYENNKKEIVALTKQKQSFIKKILNKIRDFFQIKNIYK